jgi:hypothetical protein
MTFRPLVTGILSSASGPAGGFQMTAESIFDGALIGYVSAQYATDDGNPLIEAGSVSGDTSADGGTVELLAFVEGGHLLYILGGAQSASTVTIDGTDYALAFSETGTANGNDYDLYIFGPATSLFADGVTYAIQVT